jgi:FlaA1/EpsC-like NDP-sugar epimerase
MIRVFKHYLAYGVLLLGAIDFVLLMVAAEAGWSIRLWQLAGDFDPDAARLPNMLAFAFAMEAAMIAVGVYGVQSLQSVRISVARLLVAVGFGILLLSLLFFLFPPVSFWRSSLLYATLIAFLALAVTRGLLRDVLGGDRFKRRVLVLGAGPRAARVATSTVPTSPASPTICSSSAPARSCWRSRNGATRCRSTICFGSRRPESRSTISRASSSARPGGSISTASTLPG